MSFANCSQAAAVGVFNIKKGDPNYSEKLDRDKDGVACEKAGASNTSGGKPEQQKETSTGTKTETGGGTGTMLPKTGPAEVGIGGAVFLTAGLLMALAVRRRKVHFRP